MGDLSPGEMTLGRAQGAYRSQWVGSPAQTYWKERGFTEESAAIFGLGYCPYGSFLMDELSNPGTELNELGLSRFEDGSGDPMEGRLVIPIRNAYGVTNGFSGRLLDHKNVDAPKYLNTRETEIFRKGGMLYGQDLLQYSEERYQLILVEGYFDVIRLWEHSITNAVAIMGTSLTHAQWIRVVEYGDEMDQPFTAVVVLAFDGDDAGFHGMARAVRLIEAEPNGPELKIALLPKGYDPDRLIQESEVHWDLITRFARPPMDIAIEALSRVPSMALPRALELLSTIRNPFKRAYYLDRMSRVLSSNIHKEIEEALTAINPALDRI